MKLAVVSPQVLIRESLCALLAAAGTFSSVVDYSTVLDGITKAGKSQGLVLIIHVADVKLGVESMLQLRGALPEARALLLADDPDEEFCVRALEAGAWGCLATSDTGKSLVEAAVQVSEGERWFSHHVANLIIERHVAGRKSNAILDDTLTPREWEVLALIAQGHSYKKVANSLYISKETARSHVKSIYKKLQVGTRRAAAVIYFQQARGENGYLSHSTDTIQA